MNNINVYSQIKIYTLSNVGGMFIKFNHIQSHAKTSAVKKMEIRWANLHLLSKNKEN